MEVLLLSHRGDDAPHWSEAWALAAAAALHASGACVRWLRAATAATAARPQLPDAVEVVTVVGARRPFRRVEGRVDDPPFDKTLMRLLRPRAIDVAHCFGFGAPGSSLSTWLADRMGCRAVATVRAAELLCHRQTLRDERGQDCRTLDDADRCAACCRAPGGGGLSAGQARAERLLRWLGGRSPFPHRTGFLNRADLLVGGLNLCAAVQVPSALDAELLAAGGLSREVEVVGADPVSAAARLAATYASLSAAVSTG